MQYEILQRGGKYIWELYSRFGSPLRKILAFGEADTKEDAEFQAQVALNFMREKGIQ